jgi:hypothetical protein
MISILDNNFNRRTNKNYVKRVHYSCSRIFSAIERNEKNFALITGLSILISAFGGSVKSIIVLLKQFGFNQFDAVYTFVESHLVIFVLSILTLKLITVFFVLAFLGKYGLAKFVDSTKKMLLNVDENYDKIRERINDHNLNKYFRNINPYSWTKDLDILVELGYQAFGEENITKRQRRDLYEEWYKGNANVFSLIVDDKSNEIVGYVCILPLIQTTGYHNFNGHLSQFKIHQKDISCELPTQYVCWQAVYIKDEYQDNVEYISALTRLIFLKTKEFIKEDESVIYAESFTEHGTKILKRFGFEETSLKSLQKHRIFAIKLSDGEKLNPAVRHSLDLIKNIQG